MAAADDRRVAVYQRNMTTCFTEPSIVCNTHNAHTLRLTFLKLQSTTFNYAICLIIIIIIIIIIITAAVVVPSIKEHGEEENDNGKL